jgi:hypothetical protein
MTLLLILLITGFVVFWLIRHPIKSLKFIGGFFGLLILGILTFVGLYYATMMVWAN